MKTLLIDNYDSFTYNLFQLLAEANGDEPIVVRNDEADWDALSALDFDNIVISPGPGRPGRPEDFGVCAEAIRRAEAPLLGVCLGHQGLSWVNGATVDHAPEVMHGRLSAVLHDQSPLFAGIPREFQAVRYHSLCVEQPLPEELKPIAWTSDGVLMATEHRKRPQWGVQFHPESICTEHGRRLLANFRDLTSQLGGAQDESPPARARGPIGRGGWRRTRFLLKAKRLDRLPDAEGAFAHLYGDSESAFWLDSSRVDERARFSFMGDASGPLAATILYDVADGEVRIARDGEEPEVRRESIFDYLSRETRRLRQVSAELPFDFNCGFVGYFGYELKADCGGSSAHRSAQPDAAFVFADRLIAFDHVEECTYVVCFADPGKLEEAERWIAATSLRLASLPSLEDPEWGETVVEHEPVRFRLSRSHQQYLDDIAECRRRLVDGESYEICLTNKVTAEISPDPLSALSDTAQRQPGALLRLPSLRRDGGVELLAGALLEGGPRIAGSRRSRSREPVAGATRPLRTSSSPRSSGSARRTGPRT